MSVVSPSVGCSKVDLLVVIDNSNSMQAEQESLIRSFPVLFDTIRNTDYRIMVVDTDASSLPSYASLDDLLNGNLTCDPAPGCCGDVCVLSNLPFVEDWVSSCNGTQCTEIASWDVNVCEGTLGAGRRLNANGEECGVPETGRYVGPSPESADIFGCLAQVGTAGLGNEQPIAATLSALSDFHNGPGGCNDGFLRSDAALLILIATDEEDVSSPGEPDGWVQAVLDAKGEAGGPVFVLGLVGDQNLTTGLQGGPCASDLNAAPRLQQFVQGFEHGYLGSICAADYAPFFETAGTGIETACR